MSNPPRLIDLHCDWPLQYVGEATVFDPAGYPEIASALGGPERRAYLGQVDGYLSDTAAAVIACYRSAAEWSRTADPWRAIGDLVARVAAEFPGRILADPRDHARWVDEPNGPCWAVVGVEGFDALVRGPDDLGRLDALFDRGVRVFQPAYGISGVLAGSSAPGDDRGLLDLGRAFLEHLARLGTAGGAPGPRPVLDLAHLNPKAMSEVLDWLESDPAARARLLPVHSHGAPWHEAFETPRALTSDNLARLRRLGGTVGLSVGPPFFDSAERLRAALEQAAELPFHGRPGFEGLAIGTDYLGMARALPELGSAEAVAAWLGQQFPPETAAALTNGNARRLVEQAVGVRAPEV